MLEAENMGFSGIFWGIVRLISRAFSVYARHARVRDVSELSDVSPMGESLLFDFIAFKDCVKVLQHRVQRGDFIGSDASVQRRAVGVFNAPAMPGCLP